MRALELQTLSTTATCSQRDGDGRSTGLKIRLSDTHIPRVHLGFKPVPREFVDV